MSNPDHNYFIYVTKKDDSTHYYISPLPEEVGFKIGLTGHALMGELMNGPEDLDPKNFTQNNLFMKFLSNIVRTHATDSPTIKAQCEEHKDGPYLLLDKRSHSTGKNPTEEDIIAALEVEDGEIQQISLSGKYRILTEDGFMQLDDYLHEKLVEELIKASEEQHEKK